jgi:hypothetical protein
MGWFRQMTLHSEKASRRTVGVSGAGAGVDFAWEQEKLEARKMFEKPQKPQRSVHALLARFWTLSYSANLRLTALTNDVYFGSDTSH